MIFPITSLGASFAIMPIIASDPLVSLLPWIIGLAGGLIYFLFHGYFFNRAILPWTEEGKQSRWASHTARLIPSVKREPAGLPEGAKPTLVKVRPAVTINGVEPPVTLGGLFFDRPGSDGLLIIFPGEGEMTDDFTALAQSEWMRNAGLSLWVTDYRGNGRSRKMYLGASTFPSLVNDAIAQFDAIPEIEKLHGSPFARRILLGRSIGSVPAMAVAAYFGPQVFAVILDGAITSVRRKYETECRRGCPSDWPEDQPDIPFFAEKVISPALALRHSGDSVEEAEAVARMMESMSGNEKFRTTIVLEGDGRMAPADGSEYQAVFPFLEGLKHREEERLSSRPSEPEYCPCCGMELIDGACPNGTYVDYCPDCGAIRCNCSCPNGCDRAPLKLRWPGGIEHTLSGFALKVVTCPNSGDEGFTLPVPKSFIIGRSAVYATEPYVELLTQTRQEAAQCSRRYVRFDLLADGMGYGVSMLVNHNFAFVNNRKISHEGESERLYEGETIRLNPNFELKLVRAKADKVFQAS